MKDIQEKNMNGIMNPPKLNRIDPNTGPIRNPTAVHISATAIFYSTDSGNNNGIYA